MTAAGTAARILTALVDVILDGGLPGFSVQEVADRAGVSHRTVYRHFPTRESLLEALAEAIDRRMVGQGGVDQPDEVDDVPAAVRANFALFSRDARAVEAGVRFGVGAALETRGGARRTRAFRDVLTRDVPGLSADDAAMAGAVVRHVASSRAWLHLRESGLDDDRTADAAAWAVGVLLDALSAGRTPTAERATSAGPAGTAP